MPRLRLIAGPNGSGKTTLTNSIRQSLGTKFGLYSNADEMEAILRRDGRLSFGTLGIMVDDAAFQDFRNSHPLADRTGVKSIVEGNILRLDEPLPTAIYFPTLLADFVRERLIERGSSFVFETVMSEPSKIDLLKRAQAVGYRTYLYFVCIDDPLVNVQRVADRVQKQGHHVPTDKIIQRYVRSLELLLPAISATNRAYLFDNSGEGHRLVAEVTDGTTLNFEPNFIPEWFGKYVLDRVG